MKKIELNWTTGQVLDTEIAVNGGILYEIYKATSGWWLVINNKHCCKGSKNACKAYASDYVNGKI